MTAWEKILQKVLVGSNIDSSQWNSIQAGLRDRAFFSSKVAEMNILDAAQKISSEYAKGEKDLSRLRMELKDFVENKAGYVPSEDIRGTIKDLTSKARLDVIIKTNVAQARGFIQYAEGMTPGAFAAFPAQEFTRIEHRNQPRTTWPQRWKNAGGKIYGGRMIALKDDPVWTRLSIFGEPFPPFDWGSGMGVMDVSKKEAIELGLITEDELQAKREELRELEKNKTLPSMNGNLQATVPATQDVVSRMKADFGDLADVVRVDEGVQLKWRPEILKETVLQKKDFRVECGIPQQGLLDRLRANPKTASFADAIDGQQLVIDNTWRDQKRRKGGTHLKHFGVIKGEDNDVPLKPEDLEFVPSTWRNPTRFMKNTADELQLETDTIDGSTFCLRVKITDDNGKKGVKVWTFFRTFDPAGKKNGLPKSRSTSLTQRTSQDGAAAHARIT